jgi:hypothetical protein
MSHLLDGGPDVLSNSSEEALLLPMAITRVDAEYGCVAALTEDGQWLRPGPVFLADLESPESRYAFRRPFRCRLAPSSSDDSRVEDRDLLGHIDGPAIGFQMTEDELLSWYLTHSDANADAAFSGERSAGLIEVSLERVSLQRSTQQRFFVRMAFKDASGTAYDWIVTDLHFSRMVTSRLRDAEDPEQASASLLQLLQSARVLLTVVLTKPTHRARGVVRGCQPLVGGVHTFPDYAPR